MNTEHDNIPSKLSRSECGKLGYLKSIDKREQIKIANIENYHSNPNTCGECLKVLEYVKRHNTFCTKKCSSIYNTRKRQPIDKKCLNCLKIFKSKELTQKYCCKKCSTEMIKNEMVEKWKNGEVLGYYGKSLTVTGWLRRYLFKKYDSKCCKCNWCETNTKTNKIPLEVNHIDGDASNCQEENLELICPNCHSLTHNFRALNSKSRRKR